MAVVQVVLSEHTELFFVLRCNISHLAFRYLFAGQYTMHRSLNCSGVFVGEIEWVSLCYGIVGKVLVSLSGRDEVLQWVLPTLIHPKLYQDVNVPSLLFLSTSMILTLKGQSFLLVFPLLRIRRKT